MWPALAGLVVFVLELGFRRFGRGGVEESFRRYLLGLVLPSLPALG